MTSRAAEKITGLCVRASGESRGSYGLYRDAHATGPIHTASSPQPAVALKQLVEMNYRRVRGVVFQEQNYRCWACWRILPLSCDHVKPRAHGRSDDRLNFRGLCAQDHESHTRNQDISMHPKMEVLMAKLGLRWRGEYRGDLAPYGWERLETVDE